jgi:hypothetical protein
MTSFRETVAVLALNHSVPRTVSSPRSTDSQYSVTSCVCYEDFSTLIGQCGFRTSCAPRDAPGKPAPWSLVIETVHLGTLANTSAFLGGSSSVRMSRWSMVVHPPAFCLIFPYRRTLFLSWLSRINVMREQSVENTVAKCWREDLTELNVQTGHHAALSTGVAARTEKGSRLIHSVEGARVFLHRIIRFSKRNPVHRVIPGGLAAPCRRRWSEMCSSSQRDRGSYTLRQSTVHSTYT